MDEDKLGFCAKAPVVVWNKRIGVDYPGVFKALIKATIAYVTGNAATGLSATVDGFFSFKLQERPLTPAELAWLLIRRALAHAMARLSVEALAGHALLGKESDTLIAALDRGLDDAEIWIDPAFFDRPPELSVVEAVRAPFDEWLRRYLHLDEAKAASVQRRLGAYFTFALRREWTEHSETYAPIDAEIRELETPFAKATARERAWLRNAAYLERQINEPVFEESFGLDQIYVPLRAWYGEAETSRKGRGQEEETRERRHVVALKEHLNAWFATSDKKDAIRVICGGLGSGKTSFTKIWAAKLAEEGHRVLFVPLHRLELRDERPDIQSVLWEFLRDLDVLPADPLDSSDGESRLLILFDGLDELAMQGRAGLEIARNFVEAVERKLDLLNDRKDRLVQVAFGGRDVAVQSARLPAHQVLHVLPYHGAEGAFKDPDSLLRADDYACQRWWQRFGEAVGEDYHGLPKPLQDSNLSDITAQPLLNYLLALSYRRGELDFSTAPNLNLIYRDLLDAVYQRRWGPGQHPTRKQLKREEFDDLLDELGLGAWHGAGRTVTETQVEHACMRAGLQQQLAAFQEGARAGAIGLLAAFYFRQSGKVEGERTFEFTHKSFGEYLIARRLVRAIEDIHDDREINRNNRQRGKTVEDALIRWIEFTGPAPMDFDLLEFLRREVALRDKGAVEAWHEIFTELFNDQLSLRMPMHRLQLPTYQEMIRWARNAEESLLAALYVCAAALNSIAGRRRARTEIAWPNEFALRDMLFRLQEGADGVIAFRCLGWLAAQSQELPQANLSRAGLNGADLSSACLYRASLSAADLRDADLNEANLHHANLNAAVLSGANLSGADLSSADLSETDLSETNLSEASLRFAYLGGALLGAADLSRADLYGANLDGAYLSGANLDQADLKGANLNQANLSGARLTGVRNFSRSQRDSAYGLEALRGKVRQATRK